MSRNNGKLDVEQKIWDICGILREDGMHIGTYVEQVTVLLFLKMMDEREQFGSESIEIPEDCQWSVLKEKDGEELLEHYNRVVLPTLGDQDGIVGDIFARVNSQFRTPVNLREAIREIDEVEWSAIEVDVKGTAYEALLQRYAEEAKGAGQYFTPRPAIKAIVKAVDPDHDDDIHDPAAGTGGFLIHAFEHILEKTNEGLDLSRDERRELMTENLSGMELVPETRRLGLMNLALHDLQPQNFEVGDSLSLGPHTDESYDVILTNPPYGGNQKKKRARDDFMVDTRSPELNFVQHNMSLLKQGGECGMVVPDGTLFQSGAAQRIRENLFEDFNVHTVLVLPIGAFQPYTNVATNVIFFEKGDSTEKVWFYDLRTEMEKIKKSNPLTEEHFEDFLENFDSREESEHYFSVSIEEIEENEHTLSYKQYKEFDDGDEVAPPEELLTELQSLQDTVRENTEAIMDELEDE
ncbi:class I SAM-dependent DNA methyltransferase [Haloferax volcanii]|uniref:site-specific DNA-methyltransferase (adenine-specific) n=3 Tax=Haloferax volcanii TaxID=2246 RepID=D4GVY6_HALVD|nr:type I restriction-modification system subunit M [Haloferax volcanii]ADE02452.1 type I restriction-modification system DNA-methyltransferase RmeM [Haloferax volcanii DS2]MBS8120628.1 N-6 DNA methylase [Haloferax volcanii]MBS8125665.1 N-6 DNA methylase [Haloferax volcanii]MBS8129674.1 N-6 DNA methylase [Haloferax volcanii]MBS8133539.1 N-6 DNA methylase [Haloferax volcanii]